jgi:hypothetical protein
VLEDSSTEDFPSVGIRTERSNSFLYLMKHSAVSLIEYFGDDLFLRSEVVVQAPGSQADALG